MDYMIEHGFELEKPQIAFRAQQIQGQSYVAEGFVPESAIDEHDRLLPVTDHTRGNNVEYFLATAKNGGIGNQATLRLVHIPPGGKLEDLPTWRYSANAMYGDVRREIEGHFNRYGADGLMEMAAFARTVAPSSMMTLYTLFREVTQSAIRRKSKEKWIATIVNRTYHFFAYNLGAYAMRQIGAPVRIDTHVFVNEELCLIPTLLEPLSMYDDIALAIRETNDVRQKSRLLWFLRFLCDGSPENEARILSDRFGNERSIYG